MTVVKLELLARLVQIAFIVLAVHLAWSQVPPLGSRGLILAIVSGFGCYVMSRGVYRLMAASLEWLYFHGFRRKAIERQLEADLKGKS